VDWKWLRSLSRDRRRDCAEAVKEAKFRRRWWCGLRRCLRWLLCEFLIRKFRK
jgi:hypothetical protein